MPGKARPLQQNHRAPQPPYVTAPSPRSSQLSIRPNWDKEYSQEEEVYAVEVEVLEGVPLERGEPAIERNTIRERRHRLQPRFASNGDGGGMRVALAGIVQHWR